MGLQKLSLDANILQRLFDKVYLSRTANHPDTFEAEVILESLRKLKRATEANLGTAMKYVGLSVPVFCTDSQAAQILIAAEKADLIV